MLMPMTKLMSWPPTNGQGWASGLVGKASKIIAEAPIDATNTGAKALGTSKLERIPVSTIAIPIAAEVRAASRSGGSGVSGR